jgi:hypothetical protein
MYSQKIQNKMRRKWKITGKNLKKLSSRLKTKKMFKLMKVPKRKSLKNLKMKQ